MRCGGRQADEVVDLGDGQFEAREPAARVVGSGAGTDPVVPLTVVASTDHDDVTMITSGEVVLGLIRRPGTGRPGDRLVMDGETLTGLWPGWDESAVLAFGR